MSKGHGRVVDEDVNAAEMLYCRLDQTPEVFFLRQVRGNGENFSAERLDLGNRLANRPGHLTAWFDRTCGDDNGDTSTGQKQRGALPDPGLAPVIIATLPGPFPSAVAYATLSSPTVSSPGELDRHHTLLSGAGVASGLLGS